MAEWVGITNGTLTAAINPLGAELSSLKDAAGRELMTDANPAYWGGRAPILFPIVGALNADTLHLDGVAYPMAKHGFARRSRFETVETGLGHAVLALADTAETRAVYPFAFRLEITFRLTDATLAMDVIIENRGLTPMPANFGFHPAFAWPLPYSAPREAHRVVFDADEAETICVLAADGTVAPEPRESPLDGRVLNLRDALFDRDALIWDDVRSRRVSYGSADGPQLEIAFPDTPMLGIWTKPGARYVCVEPWHGIADPEGYTGDFRDKPGVFEVPVGGEKRVSMSVTLVD